MGSMELRSAAAWLGAWEFGIADVAKELGCRTWAELRNAWPALPTTITQMETTLTELGSTTPPPHRWVQRVAEAVPKRQRELVAPVMDMTTKRMYDHMTEPERNRTRGGASTEARQWIHTPEDETPMADPHWLAAAHMRYNHPNPGGGTETTCQNLNPRTGRACGQQCGCDCGEHAVNCQPGGGVQRRHANIVEALAGWMKEQGVTNRMEQAVPVWHTPSEHAVLDIAYIDAQGRER